MESSITIHQDSWKNNKQYYQIVKDKTKIHLEEIINTWQIKNLIMEKNLKTVLLEQCMI